MKRHGNWIALMCVALLAVAGSVFWVAKSGAVTHPNTVVVPPGVQPTGNDFTLHADQDQNYCLEDDASDQTALSLSQCATRSNQEWLFAQVPNGSRGIIDGGLGECLTNFGKRSFSVDIETCTLAGNQQFFFTEQGTITTTNGEFCLTYLEASQNSPVTLPKCLAGLDTQVWHLTH
jgi:hypothetical protein